MDGDGIIDISSRLSPELVMQVLRNLDPKDIAAVRAVRSSLHSTFQGLRVLTSRFR